MKAKLILDLSYTRQGPLLLKMGIRLGKSCVEEMLKRVLGDGNLSPLEGGSVFPGPRSEERNDCFSSRFKLFSFFFFFLTPQLLFHDLREEEID